MRPAFCTILLENVARNLAPQLAFLLQVGAKAFVDGASRRTLALFGFVLVVRADGHAARLCRRGSMSLCKIEHCYLNFTTSLSSWPQAEHSNMRLSWSGLSGSMRDSSICVPHLGHSGRLIEAEYGVAGW